MSERKLKPPTSRRCVHASTSRGGATTTVRSPCSAFVSTSPGTPSYATLRVQFRRHDRSSFLHSFRLRCFTHRQQLGRHPTDLVGRRHARLHGLVQPDDPLGQL